MKKIFILCLVGYFVGDALVIAENSLSSQLSAAKDKLFGSPQKATKAVQSSVKTKQKTTLAKQSHTNTKIKMPHATPQWDFSPIVERALPAVVKIKAESKLQKNQGRKFHPMNNFRGDNVDDLFKFFFGEMPKMRPRRSSKHYGSGFIISCEETKTKAGKKKGKFKSFVVTNHHIIESLDKITVIMDKDGKSKEISAQIVGKDPRTDIVLLSIYSRAKLPTLSLGDSDDLKVGQWCIAIGSSLGLLTNTVSVGVISHVNRDISPDGLIRGFIQTDISLNQGNSGGPLFDIMGKVVGVNVAIVRPDLGTGIAFAIPANIVKDVIAQIKRFGRTSRGWLGLQLQEIDDAMADAIDMKKSGGALVNKVLKEGPCYGKIEVLDVIIKFNDKDIKNIQALKSMVAKAGANKTATMTVLRGKKLVKVEILLGEYEQHEQDIDDNKTSDSVHEKLKDKYGLVLHKIDERMRLKYDLPEDMKGVIILDMDSAIRDIMPIPKGSVITNIDGDRVKTIKQVFDTLKKAKKRGRKHVLMRLYLPRRTEIFMPFPLD